MIEPVCDENGFCATFDLHRRTHPRKDFARTAVSDVCQDETAADAAAGRHGRYHAYLIEAIVQRQSASGDLRQRIDRHGAQHGKGEEAVRDCSAKCGPRPIMIEMDIAPILRNGGESVDAVLRDLEPLGETDLLSRQIPIFIERQLPSRLFDFRYGLSPLSSTGCGAG